MKNAGSWFAFAASILCLSLAVATQAIADSSSSGGMLAASDGHGEVRLLWFPAVGRMPAGGWRLSQVGAGGTRVLVSHIAMGDQRELAKLSPQDAASIRQFGQSVAHATKQRDLNAAYGVLALKAGTDQTYATAAGLARIVTGAGSGMRRYQVTGLSSTGEAVGPTLQSTDVDPALATPLPPAPLGLRGVSILPGVALYWEPPAQNRQTPVMAYAIVRDGGGQRGIAVTPKPLLLTMRWSVAQPRLVDQSAPGDTQLTYRVFSLDVFGRRSEPATTTFFATDMQAIAPVMVSATAGQNETSLHWKPRENVHTAGYVVERSNLYRGPYVPLTFKPLAPTTGAYVDSSLRGGTVYYYRVLAVSPQGDLGPPSIAVAAQPRNPTAPARVSGLRADVGRTRVHLTWHPAGAAIAGYFVERRTGNELRFETLDAKVTPAPLYDDYFSLGTSGTLTYRIVAVGFDNKEAAASDAVSVTLVDTTPPAMPYVRGASGREGVATIVLAAAAPASKTANILVLRSGAQGRMGIVIGDPLAGNAHTFVDRNVEPGQDYWYRFVALDRYGNRSEATDPIVVHIGSTPLPTPRAPRVAYSGAPFAHVEVAFGLIPHGLQVLVQRQGNGKGSWLLVAGPMPLGTKAIDANPPRRTRVAYRIVYQATNGGRSRPSPSSELSIP